MFSNKSRPPDYNQLNDEELWEMFREGSQQALSKIFLRFYTRLYHYGIKLSVHGEQVEDGIQKLFLKLWKNRDTLEEALSVEFYLLCSLRRILFSQKIKEENASRRNREYLNLYSPENYSAEDEIILKEKDEERSELFEKALKSLSNRQKEVLYLRLQHGFTNSEIARILGLSEQRVKNYIWEVTSRLKQEVFTSPAKEIL